MAQPGFPPPPGRGDRRGRPFGGGGGQPNAPRHGRSDPHRQQRSPEQKEPDEGEVPPTPPPQASRERLTEALSGYDIAIKKNPKDFSAYYKRAATAMGMGRSKAAINDLNVAAELNPSFGQTFALRGRILLKEGSLAAAEKDLKHAIKLMPKQQDVVENIKRLKDAEMHTLEFKKRSGGDPLDAPDAVVGGLLTHLDAALEIGVNCAEWRLWRAQLRLRTGDLYGAQADASGVMQLDRSDTRAYAIKAQAMYDLDEHTQAMEVLREGLKRDPDSNTLMTIYRKAKKIDKLLAAASDLSNKRKHRDAAAKYEAVAKVDSNKKQFNAKMLEEQCRSLVAARKGAEAEEACGKASELVGDEEALPDILILRAKALMLQSKWDEAERAWTRAKSKHPRNGEVHEGLNEAKKQVKMAKRKDYYKILGGLSKEASTRDIKRSYRRMAQKLHPDKHKGDARVQAEKDFRDLAEAYEVLSDPEKKARYDNGEDIEDMMGPQGGHHGFHGFPGGFPFGGGGGGGNFEFHFG